MTDPIADMLTRIRNGLAVHKTELRLPYSKMKHRLADILVKEGYIASADKDESTDLPELRVTLKYVEKNPAIQEIRRISKPGQRIYVGAKNLPYVYDGLGIAIISTSKGLMTNKDARTAQMGGEVICEVF